MNINELKQAAQAALKPPYSGDKKLEQSNSDRLMKDFHRLVNPSAVLALIEEVERRSKWTLASCPPEKDDKVQIIEFGYILIGYFRDGNWFDEQHLTLSFDDVTHWAPFPEWPDFKER